MKHPTARFLGGVAMAAAALGAQAAPNIISVNQINGDADRPPAMATGMTFDIQNPNGTVLVPGYTVGVFGEDAKAMTDRVHDYNSASATVPLPSYLVGKEYIMIANNNRENATLKLEVNLAYISQIYLLIDNRLGDGDASNPPNFSADMKWLIDQQWFPVSLNGNHSGNPNFPDEVGIDENADGTVNNWNSVYTKLVPAGTLTLNEFGEDGRNMYGVVVSAIPEPGTVTLGLLGAGLLFARRRNRR